MNDRLKMRGWDGIVCGYYDNIQNMLVDGSEFKLDGDITLLDAIARGLVEMIPEQCTGFKDCNKDLMFVGDIIKTYVEGNHSECSVDLSGNFVIIEEDGQLLAVNTKCYSKYIKGDDDYHYSDVCPLYFICDNDPEVKVIGNIHENSELLEK